VLVVRWVARGEDRAPLESDLSAVAGIVRLGRVQTLPLLFLPHPSGGTPMSGAEQGSIYGIS
jgi:hypothetical protein